MHPKGLYLEFEKLIFLDSLHFPGKEKFLSEQTFSFRKKDKPH